jgi:chitinase
VAYAALNVVLACYAVKAFIGLRNSLVDGWIHATSLLYKSSRRRRRLPRRARHQVQPPAPDWRSVLEVGYIEPPRGPASRGSAAPAAARQPEPRRRLSLLRVLVALVVLAGAGYGGFYGVKARLASGTVIHQTWYAPYVDVTLTPTYQFQSTSADTARQTVLGFVVAAGAARCTPSWGAAYPLAQADQSLTMSSRITQLRQNGQQAIVSFGGQAHTSLDVACTSVAGLTSAYESVISAYSLKTIDLDIEGAALTDFAAEQRRAQAVANIEQQARMSGHQLSVWLTLPVEPSGLQGSGLSVIESMLRDHVSIAGINIMTMDFAQPPGAGRTMLQLVQSALDATAAQLGVLFPRYGIHLSAEQTWQRLGATVMIGQNDMPGQNFTVSDARGLARFASARHLGRISM